MNNISRDNLADTDSIGKDSKIICFYCVWFIFTVYKNGLFT